LCYRRDSETSPDTAEAGKGVAGDNGGAVAVGVGGKSGAGGKRASGGNGGQSGSAGRAGDKATGGSSGASEPPKETQGCAQTCNGDKPFCDGMSCVECVANSAPHCDGERPVVCDNKRWVKQPACEGKNPVCSNGTCASMRLLGGIAVTIPGAGTDKLRLVEPALEVTPAACAPVKDQTYCVRGGLR
jgi:hypothetical protein